jgi:hypothetical protein
MRAIGLGAALLMGVVAGCELVAGFGNPTLGNPSGQGGSASSTSSGTGSMLACNGDPTTDATLISDACGIFVSASAAAGGTGTKEKPFTNLPDALVAAQLMNRFIFVCAEKYMLTSTLNITDGVDIYGNLSCSSGTWTMQDARVEANRAELDGPANGIAVYVSVMSGAVNVDGLNVVAADATGMGASSVAVYVDTGTTANFSNGDFTSGAAMAGAAGADAPTTPATAGMNGNNGNAACTAAMVQGAMQVTNNCGSNLFSVGGQGGNGELSMGGPGSPGLPASTLGGAAGAGDSGASGWSCAANGGNGTDGMSGAFGTVGMPGTDFGKLTANGYVGVAGGDGGDGTPGQGGGGGGGARGSSTDCVGANNGGASGGSGGSGGCGGAGGKGGQGGGASIALVSANAKVTLVAVKLTAGGGGTGGRGGNGQQGGGASNGGLGGIPVGGLSEACGGGHGGYGGSGAPGAGGAGGHSLAIASTGTAPTLDSKSTTIVASTPAAGGAGGMNNNYGNSGSAGLTAVCYDFMKSMPCP